MWLIVVSIFVGIFAIGILVLMLQGPSSSERVNLRLANLNQEFAPTLEEEQVTDIRRAQHRLSTIPLLNYWLTKMNLGPAASRFLSQAGVTFTLGSLLVTSVIGCGVVSALLYWRFGPKPVVPILSTMVLPLPFLYVRHLRARRLLKLEQQLPEALGMMVSALRVGHSLIASVGAVAQNSAEPIGGEMRKCFEEQNYGVDLRTALVNLTLRVPVQDFRIFVAAVLIQKESGGNLAEVLEKVAETTRERFRLKKQVIVHTAQGRLTGWILSLLPVALGTAMYFLNPEAMSVLWTRPIGLKMLYTSACMDVVGALIIRKIVNIRV